VKRRVALIARDSVLILALSFAVWLGFGLLPHRSTGPRVVDPQTVDPDCRPYEASMEVWVPGGPDMTERMEDAELYVCGLSS
jgi:hypothetical protein